MPRPGALFDGRRGRSIPFASGGRAPSASKSLIDLVTELANEPRILDRFALDVERSGLVGEKRGAQILYLALTSRLLDRPVSVAIKGASSAGKSHLVDQVLKFLPPEAYHTVTATSPKALAFSEESISHRFLVFFEAAGFRDRHSAYFLRSMLSEGELRYEYTVGLKSRPIVRNGPTGLIVTSTRDLDAELETRLQSIHVDESEAQTRLVMLGLAGENEVDVGVDLDRWKQLQTRFAKSETRVVIPFARNIVDLVQGVAVTTRRDFLRFLDLIRANALLHQATRSRDRIGRIIATLDDYEVVRELVPEVLAVGAQTCVSPVVRETVSAVAKLIDSGVEHVSAKNVGDEIGLDKSAARRRVVQVVEGGYLQNLEMRPGRPAQIVLGDPLPAPNGVPPTVEALRRATEGAGGTGTCHQIVSQNQSGREDGGTVAPKSEGERVAPAFQEFEMPDFLRRT